MEGVGAWELSFSEQDTLNGKTFSLFIPHCLLLPQARLSVCFPPTEHVFYQRSNLS